MGETTEILWADSTFNGWIGCTEVSVGDLGACTPCYAREMAKRYGWPQWGNHPRQRTSEAYWRKPPAWERKAAAAGEPHFVFSNSLSDVFDNQVPPEWRRDLFKLIASTPNLTWLLLTKRPQNIVKLFREACGPEGDAPEVEWPRNAAIGCTVVTQAEADRDVPVLLAAKAALKPAFAFVSMEPLMEAVNIMPWLVARTDGNRLDWVITGGMTSQGKFRARPAHPNWFRMLRDQCALAGVPFLFKQWGSWDADALLYTDMEGRCPPPKMHVGPKKAGHLLDGKVHDARPVV